MVTKSHSVNLTHSKTSLGKRYFGEREQGKDWRVSPSPYRPCVGEREAPGDLKLGDKQFTWPPLMCTSLKSRVAIHIAAMEHLRGFGVPASEYLFSVNLERPSGGGDFSEHS
jgi:hypothetical protein